MGKGGLNREEVEEALKQHGLLGVAKLSGGKQDFQLTLYKSGLQISVTIPFNVYEMFFSAIDLSDGRYIEDWDECYGEARDLDYRSRVNEVLWALKNAEIRLANNRRMVEYKDQKGEWRYLFGDDGVKAGALKSQPKLLHPSKFAISKVLQEQGPLESAALITKKTGYELAIRKCGLEIRVSVFFGRYCLYCTAIDLADGHRIDDQLGIKGEPPQTHFRSALGQVLCALKNAEFRLTNDRRTVECKDPGGQWRYLFGRNW